MRFAMYHYGILQAATLRVLDRMLFEPRPFGVVE